MRRKRTVAKTKIICTLGPASQSVEQLVELIQAGMDVARLNFSHGTYEDHLKSINNVREASLRTGEHICILQDLCGPKIRTGILQNKSIELKEGADFTFTIDEVTGDEHRVTTTYRELPELFYWMTGKWHCGLYRRHQARSTALLITAAF